MRRWLLLALLVLLAVSGDTEAGFLFPGEELRVTAGPEPPAAPAPAGPESPTAPAPATSAPDAAAETEQTETSTDEYDDYGPTEDPGEEGVLEERFFFGKRTSANIGRKLGEAASSLLNTLTSRDDSLPPPPPQLPRSEPGYGTGYPYGAASPGYPGAAPSYPLYGAAPSYGGAPVYGGAPGYPRGPGYGTDPRHPGYDRTSSHVGSADYGGDANYPRHGSGPIHASLDYDGDPSYGGAPSFGVDPSYGGKPVDPSYGGKPVYPGAAAHGGPQGYGSSPGGPHHGDIQNSAADYGDYEPEPVATTKRKQKFPVDGFGRILCGRVPKWKKKACRKARRQQRRQGGGRVTAPPTPAPTPTPAPFTCPSVPDKQAMSEAQESCCGLQQKGDLYAFNNCCETLGFCPICEVDSEKLATEECCPILHEGNTLGYRQCCSRFGTCPECGPAPTEEPKAPAKCVYGGKLYPAGETMDRIASKCMFVLCKDNGAGPETVLNSIPKAGCCEREGDTQLYPPGHVLQKDDCTDLVCEDGEWVEKPTDAGAIFASPCPDGWLDLGGSCVFIWRELMTFNNATIACGKLRGSLFLPQNRAQHMHLINAFKDMKDRDSSRELGGWVNAQDSDGQWQTLQGDTLTFAPWEQDQPDQLRRTNCAGLTVTDRSEGWKDYMCDHRANMLYPICQVNKPECGGVRSGCGPYDGDMMFPPGSEVSIFSSACETFLCNENSFVVRQVNKQCCYHKEWNARAFGRSRGWYTGLFPQGGFQLYEGMLCDCTNGVSQCTQFYE